MNWSNSSYAMSFAIDGGSASSATGNAINPAGVSFQIGGINNGNDTSFGEAAGKWYEVIIYNDDQSSNRSGIETNINDFYSIF